MQNKVEDTVMETPKTRCCEEVRRLQERNNYVEERWYASNREIARLTAQVAALEKDAARYKWLREQTEESALNARAFVEIDDSAPIGSETELDAAIDAALADAEKE